jgi:hypothetical protein
MQWKNDKIVVRADKLPQEELPLAEELVAGLNEARHVAHIAITRNFVVTATQAGINDLKDQMDATSYGCVELTDIAVDWRGFRAEAQPTCTDEEFQERHRAAQRPSGEDEAIIVPMSHTNPGPIHTSENFNCFLSVVGLAVGVVAVVVLMSNPVTGFWGWVAWSLTGASSFGAYTGFVLNCTGVRAVNQRVRTSSGNRDYACHFNYYSNNRYSPRYNRYVPTYVRYYC